MTAIQGVDGRLESQKKSNSRINRSYSRAAIGFLEAFCLITVMIILGRFHWGASFSQLNPSPLWIPVVLMSAQYGAVAGVLAAFGATIALHGIVMPPRPFGYDFYSYARILAWQPTQWVTYAVIVGSLRSLQIQNARRVQSSLDDAKQTAAELADGLDRALAEINRLECRIVQDSGTLNVALWSLAKINFQNSDAVLSGFSHLISDAIGATSFTFYVRNEECVIPHFRFSSDGQADLADAPALSMTTWNNIEAGGYGSANHQTQSILDLNKNLLSAPVKVANDGATLGVILIEKIQPNRDMKNVRTRLMLLCLTLGSLLHATMQRENGRS